MTGPKNGPPTEAEDVSSALPFGGRTQSKRMARDLELWHKWDQGGRKPEHLEPLLQAYGPIFNQKVRQWSAGAVGVNPDYMRARVEKHFIDAVHKFDPSRGYALSTYVELPMNKAQRDRNEVQNVAYVSEETAKHISPVQKSIDELTAMLGRAPKALEIAQHAGIPLSQVKRVQKEVKKDVAASSFEEDPSTGLPSRAYEIAPIVREQFTVGKWANHPHILNVYDHTFGLNGAPTNLPGGQLAKKIGVSPSALSQMRTHILEEYKKHL